MLMLLDPVITSIHRDMAGNATVSNCKRAKADLLCSSRCFNSAHHVYVSSVLSSRRWCWSKIKPPSAASFKVKPLCLGPIEARLKQARYEMSRE